MKAGDLPNSRAFRGAGLDARYQHRRARDEHLHRAAADAVGPEADVLTI